MEGMEHFNRSWRWLGIRIAVVGLGWVMGSGSDLRAADGSSNAPVRSVARVWNEEALEAIRWDLPHPPVQARNLFTLSVVMYDAWAAFEPGATGYLYRKKHSVADVAAARRAAICHAAYRIMRERYAYSVSATTTRDRLDARMRELGYSPGYAALDPATPAGVGNLVAATASAWFMDDGSRQAWGYSDAGTGRAYSFRNGHLDVDSSGTSSVWDLSYWQPLAFTKTVSFGQGGGGFRTLSYQQYQGSQWLWVRPFALRRQSDTVPWIDPGPPPRWDDGNPEAFLTNVLAVLRATADLDTSDGVTMDISPGVFGANPLGSNGGTGHRVNPVTGLPYAPNVVRRADFVRVLAEFWADGPRSETPPGHWNVLANQVTTRLGADRRIGGVGPVVDPLEWDVKLYFALNAGLHDAACAAWSLKRHYEGWRPISAIRALAESESLPLIPGLIEKVTVQSAGPGKPHHGFEPETLVVRGWIPPEQIMGFGSLIDDPNPSQTNGVRWIRAVDWMPFQKRSFVTPAFPGYVSGHSTFSRAAAEILAAFTGSEFFPGGLATHRVEADSLTIEKGPRAPVELQWATYFDAADQAGMSRIWGGIHPPIDDFVGRRVGAEVGRTVWAHVRTYLDGTASAPPGISGIERAGTNLWRVRFPTLRGVHYGLETSEGVGRPFRPVPGSVVQAEDLRSERVVEAAAPMTLFRIVRDPGSGP